MVSQDLIDVMNQVFLVETYASLKYVCEDAMLSQIDKKDEKAKAAMDQAWLRERPFMGRLFGLITDQAVLPDQNGTYRFAPVRFNFVRAGHVLEQIMPHIREEIATLEQFSESATRDDDFSGMLDKLLEVKRRGLAELEELHTSATKPKKKKEDKVVVAAAAAADDPGDDLPWRDADMPLDERMDAASEASLEDKLWAAMAQTDCTACGYDCEGYAKAIAEGEETDLTKCVPGEDETADMLKSLVAG